MNATIAAEMERKHTATLSTFGESVTFWPGDPDEVDALAIVERSAAATPVSPGVISRLWIRLSDFETEPAKEDTISIGGVLYAIKDVNANSDGSAMLVVRKKSASS